jgi:hypothetical protein
MAIHPKTVAERNLLTAFMHPPVCVLSSNGDPPSRRRLNDLDGYDCRRVIVPLGKLGFLKRGGFDVLGIGIIVDLKLDMGASGDLHLRPDSFHGSSKKTS